MIENEGARLRKIRECLKLSRKDFAQLAGGSSGAYYPMETGERGISFKFMRKLIANFRVNPNYIYLGELPMFIDDNQIEAVQSALEERFQQIGQEVESLKTTIEKLKARIARQKELLDTKDQTIAALKQRLSDK